LPNLLNEVGADRINFNIYFRRHMQLFLFAATANVAEQLMRRCMVAPHPTGANLTCASKGSMCDLFSKGARTVLSVAHVCLAIAVVRLC
jgi:hypothetical protein